MRDSKVVLLVLVFYVVVPVVVVSCLVTVLEGSSKESECKEPDTQYYDRRYDYHV
jgi:hypothetical protein